MNRRLFFDNPDFIQYVRLLGRLHRLIRERRDESDEGEALREEMDRPGESLSDDEACAVKAISADLAWIDLPSNAGRSAPLHPEPPPPALKGAIDATARGDSLCALKILREHAHEAPAVVACLRGRAFEAAGLPEIAEDFFEHARRLTPDDPTFGFIWSDALANGDLEQVRSASEMD